MWRVMNTVWDLDPEAVTASERLVLLCLADHARQDGRGAWPSVARIARRTSLTRRAIQKILPRLAERSLIVREGVMARGSVRYALALDELEHQRCETFKTEPPTAEAPDCEPRSQSPRTTFADDTFGDCEPRSGGGEPDSGEGRTTFADPRTTFTRSRSDPLFEPLENQKNLGADAPKLSASETPTRKKTPDEAEADYRRLKTLVDDVRRERPTASHEQYCDEVTRRAAALALTPTGNEVGLAVTKCLQRAIARHSEVRNGQSG